MTEERSEERSTVMKAENERCNEMKEERERRENRMKDRKNKRMKVMGTGLAAELERIANSKANTLSPESSTEFFC